MAIARNAGASYFIPSEDEWYKAAYYVGGGTNAGYWTFPTKSKTAPINTLPDTGNHANFYDIFGTGNHGYTDPTNIYTPVGSFVLSPGPYGTYDMGGDVMQWNEAKVNGLDRKVRGGECTAYVTAMASSASSFYSPADNICGFRVASTWSLLWTGSQSGVWDTSTLNWSSGGTSGKFSNAEAVTFNDVAGTSTVTLNASLQPQSVLFNNNVLNYTLSVGGGISGNGSLTKYGSGLLTLATSNTYNGVTTVSGGVLAAGASNALSASSDMVVSGGTLDTSGYATSITSLNISTGGLKLGLGNTLICNGVASINGTLSVSGLGTLGKYRLLTYTSRSGSFASITGLDTNYGVLYNTNGTELDAVHKAQVGNNITVTAVDPAVIRGNATALNVNVTNSAPAQSDTLEFTASASGLGYGLGTSGSLAATSSGNFTIAGGFNSASLAAGSYTGVITVNGTNGVLAGAALNSGGTQSVSVTVLDHSSGSASGTTIGLPLAHVGYAGSLAGTTSASVNNASGARVNLKTTGGTSTGFVTINNVSGILPGGSASIGAALANGQPIGTINQTFNLSYADDSTLNGASGNLGSLAISVTGEVYSGKAEWNVTTGPWGAPGNWKDTVGGGLTGVPGVLGYATDTATFGRAVALGTATVALDGVAPLLSNMIFDDPNASYWVLQGAGTTGLTLTGSDSNSPARVTVISGSHWVQPPVTLLNNLFVNSGGTVELSGGLIAGGSAKTVTMDGSGKLILGGTGSFTGGTFVEFGTLALSSKTAVPDGTNLIVGANASLVFNSPTIDSRSASSAPVSSVPEPSRRLSLRSVRSHYWPTACKDD